jgi:xylulokinase
VNVIGIDLGTQSIKAVVCADDLQILGQGAVAHPVRYPAPGWAEQDAQYWPAAAAGAVRQALAAAGLSPGDVAAVAIAGQLDGCVAVGPDGAAVSPCLIWQDRRAVEHALRIPAGELRALTGQVADAAHMAAKIRWLRGVAAARFHQPVSYLVEQLCGEAVMDPALASTTMLLDLAKRAWSPRLLDAFEISSAQLPRLAAASAVAGRVSTAGAQRFGLAAGTVVAVGTGDDFATPLGAGVVDPGSAVCVIGTAEVVGAIHPELVLDPAALVETHLFPTGGYFVENPGWMSGGALTWLGQLLDESSAEALIATAASVPAGADGLSFLPALAGAMSPSWHPTARAGFYGFTPGHGRGHVVRAVLEALGFAARDVIIRLLELGVGVDEVVLLGGGAQSRLWAQIRADIVGIRHRVAARKNACAVGAALLALAAVTGADARGLARTLAGGGEEFAPDPQRRDAYHMAYERYRALFSALRPLF